MAPSLRAMEYFTTALRFGSIAAAAERLHVDPSAVGAAIDQVEEAFGLTLVTRQRAKGIAPTATGRVIAQRCERLLEEHRTLMAEGADLRGAVSGTLRLGYYAPVAPAFLPYVLARISPDPTALTLHLEECDNERAQNGLLDGTFDAALLVASSVRPSIQFDVLVEAPPYCLMPAGHPLAAQDRVTLAEIASGPLVVLDRPVAAAYYRALFADMPGGTRIAAEASSTEMVRSLVAMGHGCAVLNMTPRSTVTYVGQPVVARPIADDVPPLTLVIAYDKSRPRALVRRFAKECRAHFQGEEAARYLVR